MLPFLGPGRQETHGGSRGGNERGDRAGEGSSLPSSPPHLFLGLHRVLQVLLGLLTFFLASIFLSTARKE